MAMSLPLNRTGSSALLLSLAFCWAFLLPLCLSPGAAWAQQAPDAEAPKAETPKVEVRNIEPPRSSLRIAVGRITLRQAPAAQPAQAAAQRSVVVILDCSAGMNTVVFTGVRQTARFPMALDAAKDVVSRLTAQGDRVSLVLCGHRVGWAARDNQPAQVLANPKYLGVIPKGLQPYEDVEPLCKLQRLRAQEEAALFKTLDSVRPWGESPLYLGLREAIASLPVPPAPGAEAILVITDGGDNVYQPPADKRTTKKEILGMLQGRPVPVFIAACGMKPGEKNAALPLQEIAEESRGKYFDAQTPADLKQAADAVVSGKL
jgi:hypothetical protein